MLVPRHVMYTCNVHLHGENISLYAGGSCACEPDQAFHHQCRRRLLYIYNSASQVTLFPSHMNTYMDARQSRSYRQPQYHIAGRMNPNQNHPHQINRTGFCRVVSR
jgi:hypothetical protein